MKTTFLPALVFLLANLTFSPTTQAASPTNSDQEGEALETAPAATLDSARLQSGTATIVGRNVNIRAKATIHSEVVTQMQDGQEVYVEEVILRPDAKDKDPNRWAKIAYPSNATAWVHSMYVDAATGTVKARKLNVRSGPGENYTIIGSLRDGDPVVQVGSKGSWISIRPPEGATAFVAAKLLRQAAATPEVAAAGGTEEAVDTETVETEVVESETAVVAGTETVETEVVETETTETVAAEGATTVQDDNALAVAMGLEPLRPAEPEMEEQPEEPLPPRIVSREGIVRSFTSPHAPSHFKLVSPDNGKLINYLYTSSTNLDLGRYVGLHIVATGEEELDARWRTPVLTLKRIVLVDYADYAD